MMRYLVGVVGVLLVCAGCVGTPEQRQQALYNMMLWQQMQNAQQPRWEMRQPITCQRFGEMVQCH